MPDFSSNNLARDVIKYSKPHTILPGTLDNNYNKKETNPNVSPSNYIFDSDNNSVEFPGINIREFNRLGVPVTRYTDLVKDLANAQTWKEQALNMFKQMGTTIGGEAISGFGSIGALVEAIGTEIAGGDADFSNLMMEWGEQMQEFGRTQAPIYRRNPNEAFDVSDAGWWFGNAPSIASSFGLLIPGMAVSSALGKGLGLLGKMARISSMAGKGGKAATTASKLLASGAKLGRAASYYGRLGSAAVVMRNGENLKESMMVRNQMYDDVLNANDIELGKLKSNADLAQEFKEQKGIDINTADKSDIAEFVAAKAGWTTYRNDAVNLVFDMVQLAPLFRGLKPNTRIRLNNAKIVNANRVASGLKPLTKGQSFARNAAYYGLGTAGFETMTEGIEEAVNFMSSEAGLDYGKNLMGNLSDYDYQNKFSRYLKDPMLWEQAFWGAVGGGMFAGGSRAYRDVKNNIFKINDNSSTKSRVGEIASRAIGSGLIAKDLRLIDQGLNPFMKNPDGTNAPIEPGKEDFLRDMVRQTRWWDIGSNAAKHHNTNLLLSQLETPEYKQQLIEDSKKDPDGELTDEEATSLIEDAKKYVLQAEKSYIKNEAGIFIRDVPDNIKPLLVHNGMLLDKEIAQNNRIIGEVDTVIQNELNSETNNIIRESFNKEHEKDGYTYDDVLRKIALQETQKYLKSLRKSSNNGASGRYVQSMIADAISKGQNPDLEAISREALKIEDPLMADRTIKAENAINEELETLDKVSIPSDFTKKYANDILIDNMSIKTTHEILNKILRAEVEDLLVNTEAIADKYTKEFKKIKRDSAILQFKRVHRDIDAKSKKLAKAIKPEDINNATEELKKIRRKLQKDKSLDSPAPNIAKEYDNAINRITEILSYNRKLRSDAVKAGKPYEIPTDYNPPNVSKDTIEEFAVEVPAEKETDKLEETEDMKRIEPSSDSFSMFMSSILEVKKTPNSENVLSLNTEEQNVWDLVTNKLIVGSSLVIKPLQVQSKITTPTGKKRERTINEREIGVYTEDGTLVGMMGDVTTINGKPAFIHKGLVYTIDSSWITKFIIALESGKLENELKLFRKLNHAYYTRNPEWNTIYNELIKSSLLLDILNTNRQNNKLKELSKTEDGKYTDEVKTAIIHAASVINFGINQNQLLEEPDITSTISSMLAWNTKLQNDIIHTTSIRNKLDDNNVKEINVTISDKSIGSVITGEKNGKPNYTKLNNISSETIDDLETPLFFVTASNKTKLEAGNNAAKGTSYDLNPTKEDKGIEGIPYIQLKMATTTGETLHRYFRATIGRYGLENTPKDVNDYNRKLVQALVTRINNMSSFGVTKDSEKKLSELFEALKYYYNVSHVTKDGKLIGVGIRTNKKLIDKNTKQPKKTDKGKDIYHEYRILVNEDGTFSIYSEQGSKKLEENTDVLYERFVADGVMRNVYLTKNTKGIYKLSDKPFKDFVTGVEYTSYTNFLVDTGGILSFYGSARDANGNLISNVDTSNRFNRKGQPLVIHLKPTSINFKTPSKKEGDFQKPTEQYTSIKEFANAIDPNNEYRFLFDFIEQLGVIFDSKNISNKTDRFVDYDPATKTIQLSEKFYKTSDNNKIKFLAHDSIHRVINGGLTEEHKKELNSILADIKANKDAIYTKLNYNKESIAIVESILDQINGEIEELITYAMTNVTFAKILSQIDSDVNTNLEKEGIVDKLLRIIKEAIQLVFGNSALNRVANVLEDVIRTNSKPTTETTTNDPLTNSLLNSFDRARNRTNKKKAEIADIDLNIGSALSFIKSMNKEERASTRELINNGNVIFKC